ncbi:MAG: type II toxin-antitoxin system RelB/DinJ family antitoxin [Eggerthellaceae bacterium]|nr:type II toxin-antitoxin system RelB/DinJ family antitoxin [Eggerthellaceae bacterium]
MTTTNINIRIDSEVKGKAQIILGDLGLDMSTAINLFLRQVVYKEAIPFSIDKAPNPATKKPRKDLRGSLKGKVWMADDFDAPLEEMQEYM